MQLADPHNLVQAAFLFPPRDPHDPQPSRPSSRPPTPRVDVAAIRRACVGLSGEHATADEIVMHHVREEALQRLRRFDGCFTMDDTVDNEAAQRLGDAARQWHEINTDPILWLTVLAAFWMFLPCHFRTVMVPVVTARSIRLDVVRDVATRLGELNIGTPGDLIRRIRELGDRADVPEPYGPLSERTIRAIFDDITRRGDPYVANNPDVIGAPPGMGVLYPNLITTLYDARAPPAGEARSLTDNECPVCLDIIDDDLVACPTGHHFHRECAQRWARHQSSTCPTCRAPVPQWSQPAGAGDPRRPFPDDPRWPGGGVQDREELERQRPSPFPHPRGLGWHPIQSLTPCTRPSSGNAC